MSPGFSWLDLKLGGRLLAKNPGLTLIGGFAIAVAIALGAILASLATIPGDPLPFEEGDRVVAIESWDPRIDNQERRILHHFAAWRDGLRSIEDLGAHRTLRRNLIVEDGPIQMVQVAQMTASGFDLARVPPLLGRTLAAADEQEEAPPVVVLGHEVWRTSFGGDPDAVGRPVRLGREVHTVVGVMPEGFAFPLSHGAWTAFRADPADYPPRSGPAIGVFGRLAPGVSIDQAQAEAAAVARRSAPAPAAGEQPLRTRVLPYTLHIFDDMRGWEVPTLKLLVVLLLGIVCANVAILVYARTATRRGEIVLRTALGASRRRVVVQLFAEALVLASAAAVAGLLAAELALLQLDAFARAASAEFGGFPFWIRFDLAPRTAIEVAALVVIAAVIVGAVPALKATGRHLQPGLAGVGGGATPRLGRTWSTLVVAQVAVAVAILPAGLYQAGRLARYGTVDPGFAAGELLTARLEMDRDLAPTAADTEADATALYAALRGELARRLADEPGVEAVAFSTAVPGQEPTVRVEVEGLPAPADSPAGHGVRFARVDGGYLDAYGVPLTAGRAFHSGDLTADSGAVLVNDAFVDDILDGANPLGRRVRYAEGYRAGGEMETPEGVELGRWYEVVGTLGNLPPHETQPDETRPALYHPLAPGQGEPARLAVRTNEDAAAGAFADDLRQLTAAVDPRLRLAAMRTFEAVLRELQVGLRLGGLAIGLITLSVLLLSAAGLYALTSFTLARRRREIGVRAALGAHPRQLVGAILSGVMRQLALGTAIGLAAAALLEVLSGGILLAGNAPVLLPVVAALMAAVGLLAALGPARRGFRIPPTEAIRADV